MKKPLTPQALLTRCRREAQQHGPSWALNVPGTCAEYVVYLRCLAQATASDEWNNVTFNLSEAAQAFLYKRATARGARGLVVGVRGKLLADIHADMCQEAEKKWVQSMVPGASPFREPSDTERLQASRNNQLVRAARAAAKAKRYCRCQLCRQPVPIGESVRIKPQGDTTYSRFCRTCAERLKRAQKVAQLLRPRRRWGYSDIRRH